MFDEADADGGGKLDRGEVKDLLARVGMNPAKVTHYRHRLSIAFPLPSWL